MSKKNVLVLLIIGCFSIFALTGCGEENIHTPAADYPYENEYNPAYEGYIPDIMMQEPEELYHIVLESETILTIAKMYDLDVEFLMEFNGLDSEMDVVPGLLLILPPGTVMITMRILNPDMDITLVQLPNDVAFTDDYVCWNYAATRQMDIEGIQLMIQSSRMLPSFSFIDVEQVFDEEANMFIPTATDVLFYVGNLEANVRFLTQDFFTHGTFPHAGFTFIDETGTRRFFTVHQSMMSGDFFFTEFEQDDFTF